MSTRKVREVTIEEEKGVFSLLKSSSSKKEFDFNGISALRQLLSNERAKMLHTIKNQNPQSVYDLAKKLDRTFKSVSEDIKLLERFGFVEIVKESTKKRIRHRPIIAVDTVTVNFKI